MAEKKEICGKECEVYSRIVGYYRPTRLWNESKKEEFNHRVTFSEDKAVNGEIHVREGSEAKGQEAGQN